MAWICLGVCSVLQGIAAYAAGQAVITQTQLSTALQVELTQIMFPTAQNLTCCWGDYATITLVINHLRQCLNRCVCL